MRVTVLQLAASWDDPGAVLARVDRLLDQGPPSDVVLLPEMSIHGYVSARGDFDLTPFAEPEDGPTARALAALARRHATTLVGPLVLRRGERVYNAMIAHDAQGQRLFTYAKRNPWLPELWATPGEESPPLLELGGLKLTMAICYDLHFVAEQCAEQLAAADLLLFPSAWVDPDDTLLPTLRALAQAFDVAVLNANWSAGVVRLPGQGGSCVIAADGAVLARAGMGEERIDAVLPPRSAAE